MNVPAYSLAEDKAYIDQVELLVSWHRSYRIDVPSQQHENCQAPQISRVWIASLQGTQGTSTRHRNPGNHARQIRQPA